MELMGLGVVLAAAAMLVWVVLWFSRKHYEDQSRWENEDFVQLARRYESTIERLEKERKLPELVTRLIEATNANTKSLDLVETTLNQLVLRSVGFQDRSMQKQYQVGEKPAETKVGNRTVLAPAPQTRTDEGEEGFVDETGKVVPLTERTARELAATEPT